MSQRPKVLASVYACNPEKGSEDGAGWNWVRQVARFADVWAITWSHNQAAIERGLQKQPLPNVTWVYYDLPKWLGWWYDGKRGEHPHYYLWQVMMYLQKARALHREIRFDGAHHLTWGQYWSPSFLVWLPLKFVWGPVGGGESAPRSFYSTFNLKGRLYEWARDLARSTSLVNPFVRRDATHSAAALATTHETAAKMKGLGAPEVHVLPNSALSNEDYELLSQIPLRTSGTFRLISYGRLLHWKGFYLGVQAFAQFHRQFPDSEYWIFGDGPDEARLKQMAADLGVSKQVHFWGRVPRARILEALGECDVMVHPSLHDAAGWTPLEGMSAGRPVICLALGGPGLQVTTETGFPVEAKEPQATVAGLANAMLALASDPMLRQRMAEAGRRRVKEHFLWDCFGDFIAKLPPYNGQF